MTSFRSFKKPLVPILVTLQGVAVAAFIEFGRRADAAMDKSGLGNYHLFSIWDQRAGWAFLVFVGLWGDHRNCTSRSSWPCANRHATRLQTRNRPLLVPTVGAIAVVVSLAWI